MFFMEKSVSPCSFQQDFLSSGNATREQDVIQYGKEVARGIDFCTFGTHSNIRDHLGEKKNHSDYLESLLNRSEAAQRAVSQIRDKDPNYPIIYKSLESWPKSQIQRRKIWDSNSLAIQSHLVDVVQALLPRLSHTLSFRNLDLHIQSPHRLPLFIPIGPFVPDLGGCQLH